ncbi:MAG: 5'-methylthioadenosine/adenosylhomocysteine nucleosidase [Eubacterium sp.]|nr:5'-methylthioadenosine/adenosylhomocysteine nucleosidase [Eubacterium sp.]
MLGIIGAMDVEVNSLKNKVKNGKADVFANIEFISGDIEGKKVCVACCLPGKVNAALCTQLMIDKFDIDKIINVGIACSLSNEVVIGDIVVGDKLYQYDFDTSAVDGVKGLILDGKTSIDADYALSQALIKCAQNTGESVHYGGIATGDTFIASNELKKSINEEFGAVCGEMEGGAIAQVCYINSVPFAVLRTISDGGNEESQMAYPLFKEVAAKKSSEIMLNYLKNK